MQKKIRKWALAPIKIQKCTLEHLFKQQSLRYLQYVHAIQIDCFYVLSRKRNIAFKTKHSWAQISSNFQSQMLTWKGDYSYRTTHLGNALAIGW